MARKRKRTKKITRVKRPTPTDPPRLNADGACREGCTCLLCQCSLPTEVRTSSRSSSALASDGNKRTPSRLGGASR